MMNSTAFDVAAEPTVDLTAGDEITLAVVAPCFNEQDVLPLFVRRLAATLDGLIGVRATICLVDDGSRDQTPHVMSELASQDARVRVIRLSRNFGHQIALSAGLAAVSADAVVCLDADLQHPPELIVEMLTRWREGFDVVSMVRNDTEGANWTKRASSRLFYGVINVLSDTHIPQGTADFLLLSRKAHQALISMPERHRFQRGLVSWIGFRRAFIPYDAPRRAAGQSKYSWARMVRLASVATASFSALPLTLAIRVGLAVALAGFLYLAYAVGCYFLNGDVVPGWASVIGTILLMGGCQLLFVGVLGHYVAMIFEESKRRPLYFVDYDSAADCDDERSGHLRDQSISHRG